MKRLKFRGVNLIPFIILVFSLGSCGQLFKEKRKLIPIDPENEKKGIVVYINAVVLQDDVFEVYYFETGQKEFSARDYVSAKVKGNPLPQDILFELPEGVYPERLRLDFGKREDQSQMKLNVVGLYFNQKEYVFSKSEIIKGFKPSKFIELDEENMTFTTKAIDGHYDPYFYSMRVTNIVNYLLED